MPKIKAKRTTTPTSEPVLIGDVATDLLHGKPQKYVATGLTALDDLIVGIVSGEVTLIAANPTEGKTSLAMTILENAAARGIKAGIFSLEMGRRALAMRRLAGLSGVPIKALRTNVLTPQQKKAIGVAAKTLQSLPLFIDDRGGLTGDEVAATMGEWKDQGIGLVALDYVQLMSGTNESRQVQVGEAVRAIKAGAVRYDLPVLVLSQVNRAATTRENKKPRMSDLRDSGELEQVADTILMFYYPEEDKDEPVRVCEVHVVKQRNGPTGVAPLQFHQHKTRFEDF